MVLLLGQHFVLPKKATADPPGIEGRMSFWVASWASSVQPIGDAPIWVKVGFENRTLRMILRPSMGGNRIRLRICNTYGNWPLTVGKVGVALKSSGSNIRQDAIRIVTFGGHHSIRIAAGAMALTDPIPLKINAGQNLAVDLYLPLPTGPPTWHALSDLDSYISSLWRLCNRPKLAAVDRRTFMVFRLRRRCRCNNGCGGHSCARRFHYRRHGFDTWRSS